MKPEILEIPRAIRETLEKGERELEDLVRKTRWGDGPIYIATDGVSPALGLTAAYAFESLAGWPVVARPLPVFATYALPLLKPRSVVLLVSSRPGSEEVLDFVQLVRARGALLLALTHDSSSSLAQSAHGVVLVRTAGSSGPEVITVCEQVTLNFLATIAARVLGPPQTQREALERELKELPGHVEWALTQLPEALRSLFGELAGLRRLWIVGGGFFHPPALQLAERLRGIPGLAVSGEEVSAFRPPAREHTAGTAAVLLLSGSRCRVRKEALETAAQLKVLGLRLLSVTDRADRELVDRSSLAILVPVLTEMVESALILSILEWMAAQGVRGTRNRE